MIVQPVQLKAPSKSRSWKTCAGLVCHSLHYIRWIKESQRKPHSSWRFPPGSEVFISCVFYLCAAAGCSTGVVPLLPAGTLQTHSPLSALVQVLLPQLHIRSVRFHLLQLSSFGLRCCRTPNLRCFREIALYACADFGWSSLNFTVYSKFLSCLLKTQISGVL